MTEIKTMGFVTALMGTSVVTVQKSRFVGYCSLNRDTMKIIPLGIQQITWELVKTTICTMRGVLLHFFDIAFCISS